METQPHRLGMMFPAHHGHDRPELTCAAEGSGTQAAPRPGQQPPTLHSPHPTLCHGSDHTPSPPKYMKPHAFH